MKYIDADKLKAEIERFSATEYGDNTFGDDVANGALDYVLEEIIPSLQQEQDMGEVSDGYHTFNELYYYRMLYNAAFFNLLPKEWVHKSKRHHTGEECFGGGWFIVMANLPTGQISNHYELKDWDLFQVPEKEFADEWDGHTPQEAAERLYKYLQQEQPIKVNTLTWKDVNDLERIINNVHYEFRNGIGEKSFGEEVLERFREERDEQEQPDDVVVIAKTFLDTLSKTPYNNKPITDAQIIVRQLLLFFENPKEYNPDAILEQPEIELEKFTEKIKTFQGRYKHPEIVSIKGAMAFMARMFYQYPNVARQWYEQLPKVTMD